MIRGYTKKFCKLKQSKRCPRRQSFQTTFNTNVSRSRCKQKLNYVTGFQTFQILNAIRKLIFQKQLYATCVLFMIVASKLNDQNCNTPNRKRFPKPSQKSSKVNYFEEKILTITKRIIFLLKTFHLTVSSINWEDFLTQIVFHCYTDHHNFQLQHRSQILFLFHINLHHYPHLLHHHCYLYYHHYRPFFYCHYRLYYFQQRRYCSIFHCSFPTYLKQ